jgi:hypothetical protein
VAWLTSLRLSLRHFLKQFVIEVVVVGDGAGLEQEHFDRRQRFVSIARLAVAGSLRSDDVVRPRGGGVASAPWIRLRGAHHFPGSAAARASSRGRPAPSLGVAARDFAGGVAGVLPRRGPMRAPRSAASEIGKCGK